MRIKYYGTGAGNGVPEMLCRCRVCRNARAVGGKEIRTRSQAVIDDFISLDFSVDAFLHCAFMGLDMSAIHNIVITHGHYDHFLHQELSGRPQGYEGALNVYATEPSAKAMNEVIARKESAYAAGKKIRTSDFRIAYHPINMYMPFDICDYRFTPLKARHAVGLHSVIYIIEHKGKSVLWAHDTGVLYDEVFDFLSGLELVFDFVSLDCTLKAGEPITTAHMDIEGAKNVIDRLRAIGRVDDHTTVALSHIGHLTELTHEEAVEQASSYGMTVAYDGMAVEV